MAAPEAFGVSHPNFDVLALANAVCPSDCYLKQARFYTGLPSKEEDPHWHQFWQRKLLAISRQGVTKITRPLRYRNVTYKLGDGTEFTRWMGVEKGIDGRIAIDLVRLFSENEYDAAIVFSQDQDLYEATEEVKRLSFAVGRRADLYSAFPVGPSTKNRRGINKTTWIQIDQAQYDHCVDPTVYR